MKKYNLSSKKKIADKLYAVSCKCVVASNRLGDYNNTYTTLRLASELVFKLNDLARNEKLTPEQYAYFEKTSRAELLCMFLRETRNEFEQNQRKCGLTELLEKPYPNNADIVEISERRAKIYKLTRQILMLKYGVKSFLSK